MPRFLTLEFRHALRRALARPSHSLLILVVLALGLGAFLLTLSQLDAFVLRALPFQDADRLVHLAYARADAPNSLILIPGSRTDELRESATQFDAMAAYTTTSVVLRDDSITTWQLAGLAQHELFGMLGAQPLLGRTFSATDDLPGAPLVIVLSHAYWQDRFGSDAKILGRTLWANGKPATVIGVMPAGFGFPDQEELWLPAQIPTSATPAEPVYEVLARLRKGATLASAQAEAAAWFARESRTSPDAMRALVMRTQPIASRFVDPDSRSQLWAMFAAGAFVLLLACANVANLQLVRTLARERELAVRAALGANHRQLLASAFAESLMLSVTAAGIALLMTGLGNAWYEAMQVAAELPRNAWLTLRVDARMIGYALACAVLTALVSGVLPAMRALRPDLAGRLGSGTRDSRDARTTRLSGWLVSAEIALSVVLLFGTAIAVERLGKLLAFDTGTGADPATILTGRIALPPGSFATEGTLIAMLDRVSARLRSEPGVESVSAATILPGASGENAAATIDGRPESEGSVPVYRGSVDDSFADTYEIDLIVGRWFDARDQAGGAPVAIVDQGLADALLGGSDPIGRRVQLNPNEPDAAWRVIVGVTRPLHVKAAALPRRPLVLLPLRQSPPRSVILAVRLSTPPASFAPTIAAALRAESPETPVFFIRTQLQSMERHRVGDRLRAQVFGALGALGLLLACTGLYGLLGFDVAQRTREIGIRRAVGASARDVMREIVRRSAARLFAGLMLGLAAGVPFAIFLGHQLPGGQGASITATLLIVSVITAGATLATLVPARRAIAVEPSVALHCD